MPITKQNTNRPIRNTNTRGTQIQAVNLTNGQRAACQNVIAQLTFADLSGRARTIHTNHPARLDLQGILANGSLNLQVQVGANSVAGALVESSSLLTQDSANQRGVARAVISALNQSLDSNTMWRVFGNVENR